MFWVFTSIVCLNSNMKDYRDLIKEQLAFTNRLLRFDARSMARWGKQRVKAINELETALLLINNESHAYMRAIKDSTRDYNLRAAGSLLRSLLESTANAHWIIIDKSEERAIKYVAVAITYDNYLRSIQPGSDERIPQSTRDWTNSAVEHRLEKFSPNAGLIWDYCSAFTHPSATYMSLQDGMEKVLHFVIEQTNTYILTSRMLTATNTQLFNEKEQEYLLRLTNERLSAHQR